MSSFLKFMTVIAQTKNFCWSLRLDPKSIMSRLFPTYFLVIVGSDFECDFERDFECTIP